MAVHPNSLANSRPAERGEVRNPRGVNGAVGTRLIPNKPEPDYLTPEVNVFNNF